MRKKNHLRWVVPPSRNSVKWSSVLHFPAANHDLSGREGSPGVLKPQGPLLRLPITPSRGKVVKRVDLGGTVRNHERAINTLIKEGLAMGGDLGLEEHKFLGEGGEGAGHLGEEWLDFAPVVRLRVEPGAELGQSQSLWLRVQEARIFF